MIRILIQDSEALYPYESKIFLYIILQLAGQLYFGGRVISSFFNKREYGCKPTSVGGVLVHTRELLLYMRATRLRLVLCERSWQHWV